MDICPPLLQSAGVRRDLDVSAAAAGRFGPIDGVHLTVRPLGRDQRETVRSGQRHFRAPHEGPGPGGDLRRGTGLRKCNMLSGLGGPPHSDRFSEIPVMENVPDHGARGFAGARIVRDGGGRRLPDMLLRRPQRSRPDRKHPFGHIADILELSRFRRPRSQSPGPEMGPGVIRLHKALDLRRIVPTGGSAVRRCLTDRVKVVEVGLPIPGRQRMLWSPLEWEPFRFCQFLRGFLSGVIPGETWSGLVWGLRGHQDGKLYCDMLETRDSTDRQSHFPGW